MVTYIICEGLREHETGNFMIWLILGGMGKIFDPLKVMDCRSVATINS